MSPEADFAKIMPHVAAKLLPEPNRALSNGTSLRYGRRGSLAIDLSTGTFFNHETNSGGGLIDLIMLRQRCDKAGALAWLRDQGLIEDAPKKAGNALAEPPRSIFYDYCDETGEVRFRVERTGTAQRFRQHGPDGQGGFRCAKGCMSDVDLIPYRLPDLMTAAVTDPVFICEGEKDADRLASLGLVATTNPGGAGKWRADFAQYFAARTCIILPDNDEAGRTHAADVRAKLKCHVRDIAILALPDLPHKGDVSDFLDAGGTKEQLHRLALNALEAAMDDAPDDADDQPAKLLPLIDPASWQGMETPSREWAWNDYIPHRQATYLTGSGSAGKSLLTQQLCTCIALGLPFLGVETRQAVAIYATCEDDADELHFRQKYICAALGISLATLSGKLHLVPLVGAIGNELATFNPEGRMMVGETYRTVQATAKATGAGFMALDNVAHFFAGNENIRNQVAAFVGLLNQLAHDIDGSVLLLGHPNKAGQDFSGSTAWENQVRSRLFMEVPKDGDGGVLDPDARALSRGKANYARNGERLAFRWHKWAFVRDEDLPADQRAEMAVNAEAARDNSIFLQCLKQRTAERRAVSEKKSPTFAPSIFARMPEATGVGKGRLEAAMDRLFRIGKIERAELWKGDDRKPVFGLRETAGNGAVNTAAPTREMVGKSAENRAGNAANTHTYTVGIEGAAHEAAAPDED